MGLGAYIDNWCNILDIGHVTQVCHDKSEQ